MKNYDLTDLRVFIAVADEGNLSRGAQRCHLVPSSVSMRLKGHLPLNANNSALSSHLPADLARSFNAYPSARITLRERRNLSCVPCVPCAPWWISSVRRLQP